ncbi:MAG: hypothetical protein H7Y18_06325 [Clostridiaceae bacterium]|nr:hypothetical protein [Clostridiaceae bacterium]
MNYLLQPISEEKFKEKVTIRFNNINEGLSRFENFMLESKNKENSEAKFIVFMEKLFELNGEENSYVDFYFSRLEENDKKNLFESLNDEDKEVIKRHCSEIKDETIFFRLSKEAIPFITRLSTREVFFSTFYFTKLPCTIWGNYNLKFPIFFNHKDMMEKYKEIAGQCGIEMN